MASLIQIGARVGRNAEHEGATVWDFRVRDDRLKQHRAFKVSSRVLDTLFHGGSIDTQSPSALAEEAMRQEVTAGDEAAAQTICDKESGMEYPEVAQLCRVISSDTRLAVVDPNGLRDRANRHGQ